MPVVGVATIDAMRAAGADALSIDAGKTLMLDGDAVRPRRRRRRGIVVVGASEPRMSAGRLACRCASAVDRRRVISAGITRAFSSTLPGVELVAVVDIVPSARPEAAAAGTARRR